MHNFRLCNIVLTLYNAWAPSIHSDILTTQLQTRVLYLKSHLILKRQVY